jgi:hypothetical protein
LGYFVPRKQNRKPPYIRMKTQHIYIFLYKAMQV